MSDVDLLSGAPVTTPDVAPAAEIAPAPEAVEHKPATPDTSVEATVRAAFKTEAARARDEQGRFAPKTGAAPYPAPLDQKITDQDSKTKPEAPASAPAPSGPPSSWSADAKAVWPQLPPAIQAAVIKRETEASDGFRQKSEEAKAFAPVREILDSQKDRFSRLGVDAPAALRQMFTFQDMFERDPRSLIAHIVRVHGLDPRQLAQTPTATPSPAAAPPPARPQVDPLAYVREEFTRRDAASTLSAFEADPAHKHARNPEVRKAMAGALSAGAADLKAAYEQAIWAVPSVRDELINERDAAARKAAADKVASAKAAGVSLRPGSPNGARPVSMAPKAAQGASVEDAVRAAWAAHAGARQ